MSQNHEAPEGMTAARLVPYSQRWHRAKIIIRCLIFCACVLVYGLCFLSSAYAIGMGPVIIADAAWIVAEFIALCIRRSKKRGIHPIAHLILDTCFPLAYLWVAISYGADMAYSHSGHPNDDAADALVMLSVLVLVVLHSVLFVRSCIEVHQRRVTKKESGPMYFIPGGGSPFFANREPLDGDRDDMPAAKSRSVSVSSPPDKQSQKAAGTHAQLGADQV